jgi:hypothetical protein
LRKYATHCKYFQLPCTALRATWSKTFSPLTVLPWHYATTITTSEEPMPMSERHIRTATIHALAAMLLTAVISVAQTAQPSSVPTYLDPSQPVSVRVDDLVSKMTLEEKASQLVN